MNVIVGYIACFAVGALAASLVMRLLYGRKERDRMLSEAKVEAERQSVLLRAEQLSAEVFKVEDAMTRLQEENRSLSANCARLTAEVEAAGKRYEDRENLLRQSEIRNDALQEAVRKSTGDYIRLESEYRALQEKLDTQKTEIEKLHEQTLMQFKVMASNIMDEKTRTFKEMSGESLKSILDPLNRDIESFKKQVSQCYDIENKERTSLQEQIRQLTMQNEAMRREADKLSSALRGGSKVQGDWGEMILLNILRQSGLREGSDFEIQKTVERQGDNSRPDAVLHFPNHSDMIIDSKVSFTAYDNYMHAETDEERKQYARQHLESVYSHIKELSAKDYSGRNKQSPEFVIMFIPIESMFLLALDEARESGRNLWHDAYSRRIIIMTPTNLVLAVRMLQDMWRQQRLEANIKAIKDRAEKIYTQFIAFSADIDAVRISLDKAVASCESVRKRLTSGNNNLISQFEKMRQLGLEPKMPVQAVVQRSWNLLREEAGVSGDDGQGDAPSDEQPTVSPRE